MTAISHSEIPTPKRRRAASALVRLSFPAFAVLVVTLWGVTRFVAPVAREHVHPPGSHGGAITSVGADRYHLEAVIVGTELRIYMLGGDTDSVLEIEARPLEALVRRPGEAELGALLLEPRPQPGDRTGRASLFVAQVPDERAPISEITLPNLAIAGERFHVRMALAPVAMPAKVVDEAERELYLTAAGRYSKDDILANGGRTASEVYARFAPQHDHNPQPGDALCPVTRTKANAACTWVIDGKTYAFCCPPCIDEFVRSARETPERILSPEAYVQSAADAE